MKDRASFSNKLKNPSSMISFIQSKQLRKNFILPFFSRSQLEFNYLEYRFAIIEIFLELVSSKYDECLSQNCLFLFELFKVLQKIIWEKLSFIAVKFTIYKRDDMQIIHLRAF